MLTVNTKFLQINMIAFQIGNVKGLTKNPWIRLWHISILADYRINCHLCWLNVTLKMHTPSIQDQRDLVLAKAPNNQK